MSASNQGEGSGCVSTVNLTALLSFMLGATDTSRGPEVAPVGIVIVIDVALHELMVTATALSVTKLPFCEAPKPDPFTCTRLPTGPVVAETLVITGAGVADVLMETLSNVAVPRAVVDPLLTPRPM
jgi:hypothetical protein